MNIYLDSGKYLIPNSHVILESNFNNIELEKFTQPFSILSSRKRSPLPPFEGPPNDYRQ